MDYTLDRKRKCCVCKSCHNLTRHHIIHRAILKDGCHNHLVHDFVVSLEHTHKQKFMRSNIAVMCEPCHSILHNKLKVPSGHHPNIYKEQILFYKNSRVAA